MALLNRHLRSQRNDWRAFCDESFISSDEVLAAIMRCESGWESSVPHQVEAAIKQHGLFGFPRLELAGPPAAAPTAGAIEATSV